MKTNQLLSVLLLHQSDWIYLVSVVAYKERKALKSPFFTAVQLKDMEQGVKQSVDFDNTNFKS